MIFPSKPPFIVVVHVFFSYVPMFLLCFSHMFPCSIACFFHMFLWFSYVFREFPPSPSLALLVHPGYGQWPGGRKELHIQVQPAERMTRPSEGRGGTIAAPGSCGWEKKTDSAIGKRWFVWGLWWFMANWWWQNGDLTIGKWGFNHQKFEFNTDLMGFMANWWWQT